MSDLMTNQLFWLGFSMLGAGGPIGLATLVMRLRRDRS